MTKDGKIGSIYFDDSSRIRTTHFASPTEEQHDPEYSAQFNVNNALAQEAYEKSGQTGQQSFDKWLANELNGLTPENLPPWAKQISRPNQARNLETEGRPDGAETLFEIFTGINGKVESWHPSRGTATTLKTDKQTIAVLRAALAAADEQHPRVTDHEQQDPQIRQRRRALQKEFSEMRKQPTKEQMEQLYADPVISEYIEVQMLTRPSIDDLDSVKAIRERIDELYHASLQRAIEEDDEIEQRMQEIDEIRHKRNVVFYNFVKSRLPKSQLLKALRKPSKV
jgi:hypothetical protein